MAARSKMQELRATLEIEFDEVARSHNPNTARPLITRTPIRAVLWDKSQLMGLPPGSCWYCGISTHPFKTFAIDHIIPQSAGGDDSFDNLVPCCRSCNTKKSNRSLGSLREILGRSPLRFTDKQIQYLADEGFTLPKALTQTYQFAFEKWGKP